MEHIFQVNQWCHATLCHRFIISLNNYVPWVRSGLCDVINLPIINYNREKQLVLKDEARGHTCGVLAIMDETKKVTTS